MLEVVIKEVNFFFGNIYFEGKKWHNSHFSTEPGVTVSYEERVVHSLTPYYVNIEWNKIETTDYILIWIRIGDIHFT